MSEQIEAEYCMRGELYITAVAAKELYSVETLGKQDPYVRITINGVKKQTNFIPRGGTAPKWGTDGQGERLGPWKLEGPELSVGVEVLDHESVGKDRLIAENTISLVQLTETTEPQWFRLLRDGQVSGTVLLSCSFKREFSAAQLAAIEARRQAELRRVAEAKEEAERAEREEQERKLLEEKAAAEAKRAEEERARLEKERLDMLAELEQLRAKEAERKRTADAAAEQERKAAEEERKAAAAAAERKAQQIRDLEQKQATAAAEAAAAAKKLKEEAAAAAAAAEKRQREAKAKEVHDAKQAQPESGGLVSWIWKQFK